MATLVREAISQPTTPTGAPGRFLIQLLDAGEGSSGYYSPAVLEQAATDKIFPAGTHMYVDHAAAIRRGINGERSVRDLAATLTEDARYDPARQALVAEVLAFSGYAQMLTEMQDAIGTSISAWAETGKPREGSKTPTIVRLTAAESVDFVVAAGRGGRILAVLESAAVAAEVRASERGAQLDQAVRDAHGVDTDTWVGVADHDPEAGLVWFWIGDDMYQQTYVLSDDGTTTHLTGTAIRVRAVTQYVPVDPVGAIETTKEGSMPEITQERLDALVEAEKRAGALEAEHAALNERAEKAEAALADAEKAKLAATNEQRIAAATEGLPTQMAARIRAQFADRTDEVTEAELVEAVTAEKAYLASVTESRLTGFGITSTAEAAAPKRTRNAFGREIKEN